MTCGVSKGLQDISSAFTSVKDKLNEKISAGLDVPSAGKGIGTNISTMKADMETAMADLKAKMDIVIPEVSAKLPNLQTAAEEAANKLKAAAAEINPVTIAALQADAAAKFEEIRTKWGSVNTPGVNIETLISDVNKNFASIDFCSECPNVDLVDTGDIDEAGEPIYDTVKKGITAEQPAVDSVKPKDPVDKKKENTVKPAIVPTGDDATPIKTEKNSPNPKPPVTVVPKAAAPPIQAKVQGYGQSFEAESRLLNAGLEMEALFIADNIRIGGSYYKFWRPQNYMNQLDYEKFFTEYVSMRRRSLTSLLKGMQKSLARQPDNKAKQKTVQSLEDKLYKMNEVKTLPYTGNVYGTYGKDALLKFVPGFEKKWQETDCPKALNFNTESVKTVGKPLFWLGHEYVIKGSGQFNKPRPVWNQETKQWDWAAGGGGEGLSEKQAP
jgi:hypothetical protein